MTTSVRVKRALRMSLLRAAEKFPASNRSRRYQRLLRSEISQLPPLEAHNSSTHDVWTHHRQQLRDAIMRRDARFFHLWPFIQTTMYPTRATYISAERMRLKAAGPRWSAMADEAESSNRIHQAHHLLAFEEATGRAVDTFGSILEFGGGYGVMAETLKRLGIAGRHTIYDLPEFAALQRYYLGRRGVRSVDSVSCVANFQKASSTGERPRLFIATWSLSEAPLALREEIFPSLRGLEGYLIAYQEEFAGVSNSCYFRAFREKLPQVTWRELPIEHLPGNRYLIGNSG